MIFGLIFYFKDRNWYQAELNGQIGYVPKNRIAMKVSPLDMYFAFCRSGGWSQRWAKDGTLFGPPFHPVFAKTTGIGFEEVSRDERNRD